MTGFFVSMSVNTFSYSMIWCFLDHVNHIFSQNMPSGPSVLINPTSYDDHHIRIWLEAKKNSMRKDRARKYIQSGPPCRSAADKEYLSFTSSLRLSEFADKMRIFNLHCIALFATLHFARGKKSLETHKTNTTNDTGTLIDLQESLITIRLDRKCS